METLARVDRTKAFLAALALGLAGLFLPVPYGPLLLLAVVVAMAVLLRTTWPVTPPAQRGARILILAGLAAIALIRLFA
jgi:uncharacterized protein DUF6703